MVLNERIASLHVLSNFSLVFIHISKVPYSRVFYYFLIYILHYIFITNRKNFPDIGLVAHCLFLQKPAFSVRRTRSWCCSSRCVVAATWRPTVLLLSSDGNEDANNGENTRPVCFILLVWS